MAKTIRQLIRALSEYDNTFLEVEIQHNFKLYEIDFVFKSNKKLLIRVKDEEIKQ